MYNKIITNKSGTPFSTLHSAQIHYNKTLDKISIKCRIHSRPYVQYRTAESQTTYTDTHNNVCSDTRLKVALHLDTHLVT